MLKYAVTRPVTNVVVFGCGGTGSRLVPLIAQLLTSHEFTKNVRIVLVDGDEVEEKNTKRQLFTKMDVGKNKAEVLAKRYRIGFEAKVVAVPGFVPPVSVQAEGVASLQGLTRAKVTNQELRAAGDFYDDFLRALTDTPSGAIEEGDRSWLSTSARITSAARLFNNTTVFVSCVDSADARRRILQFVNNLAVIGNASVEGLSNSVLIDCGNEDLFGQVTYFNPVQFSLCPFPELLAEIPDKAPFGVRTPVVPMPLNFYLTLKDAETRRSCADMDQTLAINNTMANLAFSVFQNLVYGLEMDFHTIYANVNGTYTTERLTLPWLKGVLSTNQNYLKGVLDGIEDFQGPALSEFSATDTRLRCVQMFYGLNLFPGMEVVYGPHFLKHGREVLFQGDFIGSSLHTAGFLLGQNWASLKTPMSMFTRSTLALSSWTEVVWPLLAKGLSTGFVPLSNTLKKFAVLTASAGVGKAPLSLPVHKQSGVTYQTFQCVYGMDDYHKHLVALNQTSPFVVGDLTLSDESTKDEFVKNTTLSLGFKDSITGENVSVILPSANGNILSSCRVRIQLHRVDDGGVGRPAIDREATGVLSSIVCFAVVSSLTAEEIRGYLKELKDSYGIDLLLRPVKSLMASARGYTLGVEGVSRNGELAPNDLRGWFINVHEKYGRLPMLFSEWPEGARRGSANEGDMTVFGKTLAKTDICISVGGRVYQKDELEVLQKEASKGTVLQRVLAAAG